MSTAKTKFEITMNIEVADEKDVNGADVPVGSEETAEKISKAIENIYFIEPIDIQNISVSRTGRTNITPKVIK